MELAGKRIVVTGGAGFLGRHVVDALRQRGCEEIVVPRRREFDLTHEEAVRRLYGEARPQVVMHLAGDVGGIGANRAHPGRLLYNNLMMGALLMEHARRAAVEKFVCVGTICAYPKLAPVPFQEDALWDGYPEETNAPYALAKKLLLVQGQAYREEYGFDAIHLLPVNLYGPWDTFDPERSHVIPALIRKAIEAVESGAGSFECWGDGSPTREFLYVGDCAEGIVLAAERYDGADPVNLGAGFEIPIKELAELIAEMVGFSGRIEWNTSQPNGQPRRQLDTTRARERFGFEAQTGFREGLARTIAWYRGHREEGNSR